MSFMLYYSDPTYIENETHGANFPQPPPELLEGEEVYKVESITKH